MSTHSLPNESAAPLSHLSRPDASPGTEREPVAEHAFVSMRYRVRTTPRPTALRTALGRALRRAHRRTGRHAFTLIEVMMALVILSVVVLALAGTTVSFLHGTSVDRNHVIAATAADARINQVRAWPTYTALSSFTTAEADTPLPGWTRNTQVTQDTAGGGDVTRITVTVTAPVLAVPVARSLSIAAN